MLDQANESWPTFKGSKSLEPFCLFFIQSSKELKEKVTHVFGLITQLEISYIVIVITDIKKDITGIGHSFLTAYSL